MLNKGELKSWLQKVISSQDKLLLILSSFDEPKQVSDIKNVAKEAGFKIPTSWNVSSILARTKGLAIRVPEGWEISEAGKLHLRNLGVSNVSPAALNVATDLRKLLDDIADETTRKFVEEAIKCYEFGLFRSAIVMSWLAAVDVLQRYVVKNELAVFNAEAKRVDTKWKGAKNSDDIGRMKESDFLDRLVAISVIGKNVKEELAQCLKRRNGCGHPNSLQVGQNTVAHHLEILLMNVFKVFK